MSDIRQTASGIVVAVLPDAILNSYAKPHRRAFEYACKALDVEPVQVFFTDDSESKLRGAVEIGMTARLYLGLESLRRNLVEVGLKRA